MLRQATQQDLQALVALRCAANGSTAQDAQGWLLRIAGLNHIFVVEKESGAPQAMLAAVPVAYGAHKGIWFTGVAAVPALQHMEFTIKLVQSCVRAFAERGAEFAVITPSGRPTAQKLEELGFRNLLPLRMVQIPIGSNLMAQAEFDALPVRALLQEQMRYQPGCITLPQGAMEEVMTQLYRRGATVVSNRRGYGIFYEAEDTLQFLELQAENDHCADVLLQAARNKTGVGNAKLLLAGNQALYLGAGRRFGYGMIAFLKQPFSVVDAYFRMLL